jgi:hypothetical protein
VPTWILIALIALGVATLPAACGSAMYVHALWEAGNRRCGDEVQPGAYGGWGVGFNGETDAFVCTVRDAKLRSSRRRRSRSRRSWGRPATGRSSAG